MSNTNNTSQNPQEEKMPFRVKLKKYRIMFGYYRKKFVREFNLGYVLFAVSLLLFLFISVPNLLHRVPFLGESSSNWPIRLELRGSVMMKINESNFVPVAVTKVEIGGYSTYSDSDGVFKLTFTSRTSYDIPVVLEWLNQTHIERVSFQQGQFEKEVTFTLG